MNFSEIKELIKLINDSDLSYFEIQDEKDYIKMDKSLSRNYINTINNNDNVDTKAFGKLALTDTSDILQLEDTSTLILENKSSVSNDNNLNNDENDSGFEYIKSPIVGTYYKATSPTLNPFVTTGQMVKKGEVVCIIEAMKLMNEISAEFDCEIIDILGEDGKMVEYGQPLFKVRRL